MLNKIITVVNDVVQDRDLEGESERWINWKTLFTSKTCLYCGKKHGSIIAASVSTQEIPVHDNCACSWVPMRTELVGTATELGFAGVDAALAYMGTLPEYYVSMKDAISVGRVQKKGNLADVLPGFMIGGDIYHNDDKKLPDAPGRVWREADIDYEKGFRNRRRILYSNDGLIFASYDHYHTFYEITQ
jgi:hypothetical protein